MRYNQCNTYGLEPHRRKVYDALLDHVAPGKISAVERAPKLGLIIVRRLTLEAPPVVCLRVLIRLRPEDLRSNPEQCRNLILGAQRTHGDWYGRRHTLRLLVRTLRL